MSYIISTDGILIAVTAGTHKSGDCRYAKSATADSDLYNAKYAKISNAKKWDKKDDTRLPTARVAKESTPRDFVLSYF